MASDAEYASYAAAIGSSKGLQTVKETPLSRLSGAVDRLRKAEAMASSLSNKLVGEQAQNDAAEATGPVGSGMLGDIEELANVIIRAANNITSDLSRIERRI